MRFAPARSTLPATVPGQINPLAMKACTPPDRVAPDCRPSRNSPALAEASAALSKLAYSCCDGGACDDQPPHPRDGPIILRTM